jgi:Zn-dependent protease with chaperone function
MFWILATCVCLAALFLVLFGSTLLSWPLLRTARRIRLRPASIAGMLFAGRVLPLLLGLGVTLGLVLPAFLRFEPRSTAEGMGVKLMSLAAAGVVALLVMAVRGLLMLQATARMEKHWRAGSEERWVNVSGWPVRVTIVAASAPGLLAVTGCFRPQIFVARQAAGMLSSGELSAALSHELAHVRWFDNLKRLLLHATRPPRWMGGASLDAAWTNFSEVAADEAALANGASALDLASALVKMGAFKNNNRSIDAQGQLAVSHLVPGAPGSSLGMRIDGLQRALEGGHLRSPSKSASWLWIILGAISLLAAYLTALSTLLPAIHEALEFLVR